MNTTVIPYIGFYQVSTVDQWGIQVHQVGKDKGCTCGGTAKQPCRHIHAVAKYLRDGGERAAERRPVRDEEPLSVPPAVVPVTCPICDAPVVPEGRGHWRCPGNSSHYFQWRGELNDGAIRKFFTQPHPNKVGAFYGQTIDERKAFRTQATRRIYAGGYTPYS